MSYDSEVAQCLQNANAQKKRAMLMAAYLKSGKARKFFEPALAMAKSNPNCSVSTSASQGTLYVWIYVRNLESFKSPAVEGMLNVWEYLNPSHTSQTDYPASLNKDISYRFDNVAKSDDGMYNINAMVQVQLYVKEDSPTCRKVVVGYTEGKPEPIYELTCDDGSQAIPTPGESVVESTPDVFQV
jgi:hypothetical protein